MKPTPLEAHLFEFPYEYDFFQAVRLLALMFNDLSGVGRFSKPDEEIVRFRVRQSLEFPASAIHALTAEVEPPRMTVAFFGLTGVQGVLPHFYTEHLIARASARDHAMAEFLDIFNHRLLSLFYRAWEKHRFAIRYELASAAKVQSETTGYLWDLIGLGTNGLRGRMHVADEGLVRYAGLWSQVPSALTLAGILRDHLGAPVEVEEFQGAWYSLSDQDRCNLDGELMTNQLGVGATAGDASWDPQARFRIRVGPVAMTEFLSFLPGSKALRELDDITRLYVGPSMQFEVQLVLLAQDVPLCSLDDDSPEATRLGLLGWLKTEEFSCDVGDPVFLLGGSGRHSHGRTWTGLYLGARLFH